MYKVVSLFTGCGGADLGTVGDFIYNGRQYEKLPCKVIYACDIDPKAIKTYKENFTTEQIVCGDICDVDTNDIPNHDILTGGFPCQSFSTVNPNKNPYDERGMLYKQMARIISDKQPKVFIAENVKGLMTLRKGEIFSSVIDAFEEAGYKVFHRLLNAADYGVPQKRQRVFIVGIRKDIWEIKGDYTFPKKTTENNWLPLSIAVPNLSIDDSKYYFSEKAVQGMKNAKNNMKRGLAQNLNEPCLTITSHLAKVSINSRDPVLLVNPEQEIYRRFTPQEAARIQSFPDSFKFVGSDFTKYCQIGNAIPPVLFYHIITSVIDYLEKKD